MFNRIKKRDGFTMLESILSTTILGVGLMAGMMVMKNSVIHTANADCHQTATELAKEKIESILADKTFLGYDHVIDATNYPTEKVQGNYKRTVTIKEVDPDDLTTISDGSGLNKIEVAVEWGTKSYQIVRMTTLIADYNTGS